MLWASLKLGAIHKRCQNFFGHFWYPPSPCRNFDPDLPNFYLLISCNIGISDPLLGPFPLKYSDVCYGWPPGLLLQERRDFQRSDCSSCQCLLLRFFRQKFGIFFSFGGLGFDFNVEVDALTR